MKYRIRVLDDAGRVASTEFVVADSIAEADALFDGRTLVEPMVPCAGCGAEMGQTDPRTARYPDGRPVHPDPDRAYDGIRCLSCGPAPR